MMFKTVLVALSLNALADASAIKRAPKLSNTVAASSAASTCLNANAVQSGSFVTGQQNDVPANGQSNSAT